MNGLPVESARPEMGEYEDNRTSDENQLVSAKRPKYDTVTDHPIENLINAPFEPPNLQNQGFYDWVLKLTKSAMVWGVSKERKDLQDRVRLLTKQLQTEQESARVRETKLQTQINTIKSEKDKKDKEIMILEHSVEEKETEIKQAQEAVFSLASESKSEAFDDSSVRQSLESAISRWKPWAEDWAISVLPPDRTDVSHIMYNYLGEVIIPDSRTEENLGGLLEYHRKTPAYLLHAILANFICKSIFERPFFFLESSPDFVENRDIEPPPIGGEVLSSLLSRLLEGCINDELRLSKVHRWRSDTMRLLVDPNVGPLEETPKAYMSINQGHKTKSSKAARTLQLTAPQSSANTSQRLGMYCYHAVSSFLNGPGRLFVGADLSLDEQRNRDRQLTDILREAAQLSIQLWSQRTAMRVLGAQQIYHDRVLFSLDSKWMEPHRGQIQEENDHSKDGLPIKVVIQPAIVAFGNEQGTNYDRFKVWSKAVVWVSERKGLKDRGGMV